MASKNRSQRASVSDSLRMAFLSGLRRLTAPGAELTGVHVFVDPGELAVAAAPDDADPERALVAGVLYPAQRVLDHEAVLEGVDDPIVVGPSALALVAGRQRGQVLVAGGVAPED